MNAPATFTTPQDRAAERRAIRAANIKRAAKRWAEWAEKPDSDYRMLVALDASQLCIDSDLSEDIQNLCHELRCDAEGYPLNDDGDREAGELVFVPALGRV